MTPQQLLDIVREQLQRENATTLGEPARSLSGISRDILHKLSEIKQSVPLPSENLPSAECLAAFSAGQATVQEELAVLSACVHDTSMLLQLLSIEETRYPQIPLDVASANLHERLFRLKPLATSTLVQTSAESALQPHDSLIVARPRAVLTRSNGWSFAMVAASVAIACIGIALATSPWRSEPIANEQQQESAPDSNLKESKQQSPTLPPAEPKVAPRELSRESWPLIVETPPQDNPRLEAGPTIEQAPNFAEKTPTGIPPLSNEMQVRTADAAKTKMSFRSLVWTNIVGLVLQPDASEYDTWKVVGGTRLNQHESLLPVPENSTWLTLPNCYAEARCDNGSRLVIDQDTLFAVEQTGEVLQLRLDFGSVYAQSIPQDAIVVFTSDQSTPVSIAIKSETSLRAWVESDGLYISISQGLVELAGQTMPLDRSISLATGRLQVGSSELELPAWCKELPKETAVPRSVLANFDASMDVAQTIDQQLARFSKLRVTPQSREIVAALTQWRISIGVNRPLDISNHPMLPIRVAFFGAIMSDSRDPRAMLARRRLNSLLPAGTYDKCRQIIRRQTVPTRQDVGEWLGYLVANETSLAAFGDYMLRTQYPVGPDFDPSANRVQRDQVRTQWTRVITGR